MKTSERFSRLGFLLEMYASESLSSLPTSRGSEHDFFQKRLDF